MIGFSVVDPDRRHAAPQFRQVGHIGAGRKRALAGPGQYRDPLRRAVEFGESLLQLDRDRLVDRVQLFRPVDRDDRDRAAVFDRDDAHSCSPRCIPAGPESALETSSGAGGFAWNKPRKRVYNSGRVVIAGGLAMDLFKEFGVKDPEAAAAQIPVIDFGPLFCRRARRARPPRRRGARRLRECRVLLCAEPRRARSADRPRLRRLAPLSRAAARGKTQAPAEREQYRLPADQRLGAGRLDRAQGDPAEPERELFYQPRPRPRPPRRRRRKPLRGRNQWPPRRLPEHARAT